MSQTTNPSHKWLDEINWNESGLLPVITQELNSGKVLMLAWMNYKSLQLTVESGYAVYWSRSRKKLWHKGEQSGNRQRVHKIRLDCDADVLLMMVEQQGGISCHTGRENCFYRELEAGEWKIIAPVLKDPQEIYKNG